MQEMQRREFVVKDSEFKSNETLTQIRKESQSYLSYEEISLKQESRKSRSVNIHLNISKNSSKNNQYSNRIICFVFFEVSDWDFFSLFETFFKCK